MTVAECERAITQKGRLINKEARYNNQNYTILDAFPAPLGEKIKIFATFYIKNKNAQKSYERFVTNSQFGVYVFLENDVTNQNLIVLLDDVQVL